MATNRSSNIDWPTPSVFVLIYTAFALLTWNASSLGWFILVLAGACLVCLHGSRQHEVLREHITLLLNRSCVPYVFQKDK